MIKKTIRKMVAALGYNIVPVGFELRPTRGDLEEMCYRSTVLALGKCTIVVIGANDGVSDDPLYPVMTETLKDRTKVVLFEPQADIVPFLEENYAFHPDRVIINEAIGPGETLTLYSVAPAYWPRIRPGYAKDWPDHGAPTGVTSTIREHVVAFLERNGFGEEALVGRSVPCGDLKSALDRHGVDTVDVIQIDAEGFDDEVIYASNIDTLKPRVIFYEHASLTDDKQTNLEQFLSDAGYRVFRMHLNTICVRG